MLNEQQKQILRVGASRRIIIMVLLASKVIHCDRKDEGYFFYPIWIRIDTTSLFLFGERFFFLVKNSVFGVHMKIFDFDHFFYFTYTQKQNGKESVFIYNH